MTSSPRPVAAEDPHDLALSCRYAFKVAVCVGETVATPFSEPLRVTAPGALPAGGQVAAAPAPAPADAYLAVDDAARLADDATDAGADADAAAAAAADAAAAPDEPLTSRIDDEWRVAWSEDRRRPFYHNIATGRSQWTPPLLS